MAQDMHDFIEEKAEDGTWARIAYQTGVLVPTREQKRTLLRAIGAHVLMYPVKHEYTQAHDGQRWELQISVPGYDNGGPLPAPRERRDVIRIPVLKAIIQCAMSTLLMFLDEQGKHGLRR